MNWMLLVPLLVTTVVAIFGWFIAHVLTTRRDLANKRRQQRIDYLIEAYRRLESCAHRGDQLEISKLESAVTDIQLFGTSEQVRLVQFFLSEIAKGEGAFMDELLQDLRRDLRNELKLERVPSKTMHLRMVSGKCISM